MANLILGLILIGGGLFFIISVYFYIPRIVISETQKGKTVSKKYFKHLNKFYFTVGIIYILLGVLLLLSILTRNIAITITTILSFVIIPVTALKINKKYNN
ncbi:hypothetical protein [Clostridium sp.]|uniref:hypothetical protein n=1 Tax=Clostridium sp. TaxID=1506 RepID=UPI002847B18F|nr:hypothetical protein [Clostridium sp.]MDR3598021.1 hypothetical protein [Clostridium sp.]